MIKIKKIQILLFEPESKVYTIYSWTKTSYDVKKELKAGNMKRNYANVLTALKNLGQDK